MEGLQQTEKNIWRHFLGDVAEKRFRLLVSMLPLRGLSVCLSRSCIVLKRQKISTRFFASPIMSLPDRVKIWFTSVNSFLPEFDSPPVDLSAGDIDGKLRLNGYR